MRAINNLIFIASLLLALDLVAQNKGAETRVELGVNLHEVFALQQGSKNAGSLSRHLASLRFFIEDHGAVRLHAGARRHGWRSVSETPGVFLVEQSAHLHLGYEWLWPISPRVTYGIGADLLYHQAKTKSHSRAIEAFDITSVDAIHRVGVGVFAVVHVRLTAWLGLRTEMGMVALRDNRQLWVIENGRRQLMTAEDAYRAKFDLPASLYLTFNPW